MSTQDPILATENARKRPWAAFAGVWRVLLGLGVGLAVGLIINAAWTPAAWSAMGIGDAKAFLAFAQSDANAPSVLAQIVRAAVRLNQLIGDLFVRALRFCAVPIVLFTLVAGSASLGDIRKLGRIGGKSLALFLCTTVFAVVIGLTIANVVKPGSFVSAENRAALLEAQKSSAQSLAGRVDQMPSLTQQLLNMVPRNPFEALAGADMLGVIVLALVLGLGLTLIPKERSGPVIHVFDVLGEVMGLIVGLIMRIAPVAVFCLIVPVAATLGTDALKALGAYCLCVIVGLLSILFIEYGLLVRILGGMSATRFYRGVAPAQLVAFSTSSSNATLPVTMECAIERLGVPKRVASFVCPLGATVNMDGTALYQGIAVVFVAQAMGVPLSLEAQLSVVLASTLASVGSPGIPGGSLIFLLAILQSVGVPPEGIALILGVDRVLDMSRTVVNVSGDAAVSVIVARGERGREDEPALA
ncbi:MAG: dicarboxylate/amino acid:cation symporter [Phycisphaerales bacterium]|nr:dicarboxylate/amino acid:cation symporter [Phycisphaerales bacterium]